MSGESEALQAGLDFEEQGFDGTKYEKASICDLGKKDVGRHVVVFGWVTRAHAFPRFTFVDLTSHLATLQCVIPHVPTPSYTFSTTLTVWATVQESKGARSKHPIELHAQKVLVYNGEPAPSFPLNAQSDRDTMLEKGHLALRLPFRSLFLVARSELLRSVREFFSSSAYTEITPPTIVKTQVEGGATLFRLNYYGTEAYLTQSSQLYLETVAPVLGKAYCIMPSYRAENSKTSRHLSEYTHVEAELVDITFGDLMDAIEALVRTSTSLFYERCLDKIRAVHPKFEPLVFSSEPFKRISYHDAIEFLISERHTKPDGTPYQMMDDISDASERFIVEKFGKSQPVFLTHFPVEHKPFYMRRVGDVTESCDLLFPGIGEIVGGSMRADRLEDLAKGFEREGIDPAPYEWYLDMARYGPAPHGGFGLGFERLMMGLMRYANVDMATLYPRKVTRVMP